jgi:hypothetical protein
VRQRGHRQTAQDEWSRFGKRDGACRMSAARMLSVPRELGASSSACSEFFSPLPTVLNSALPACPHLPGSPKKLRSRSSASG